MSSQYYQEELDHLRRLAVEFSRAHPALAPLLAGASSDPDVERLLEGTAFLTGLLSQKLDNSYASLGENLASLVLPQLLQDIPSCTIMRFTPKAALAESIAIPAGSRVSSVAVDDTPCVFSTAYPVDLHPLRLVSVETDARPGRAGAMHLHFELRGMQLPMWKATSLRLHLTGQRTAAMNRLACLCRNVEQIHIRAGDTLHTLPENSLSPVGFSPDHALFPYPPTAYPGFRLLQEYYIFPEKFFFLDILHLDSWTARAKGAAFTCILQLREPLLGEMLQYGTEDFALFATPAVNLFPYETSPIQADQRQSHYRIRANSSHGDAYYPHQVLDVKGLRPGAPKARTYLPQLSVGHAASCATYTLQRRKRQDSERHDLFLSLLYPAGEGVPEAEILSLNVLYSNGALPERLKMGDVRVAVSTSPALADFTNLLPPTPPVPAPAGGDPLWSMLAHLHLNYLPLAEADTLRALLATYLPRNMDVFSAVGASKKRIEAITEVHSAPVDRLWKGRPVRGVDVTVTLDEAGFSSAGDMYFFSMILAYFLQEYAAINSFVRVCVADTLNKHRFQWKEHQGRYFPL